MEYINCNNNNGPMVVVFSGGCYFFDDAFSGVVAIAQRTNIETEVGTDKATFEVEYCSQIDPETIKRIISRQESKYMPVKVNCNFHLNKEAGTSGLPYSLEMKAIKRK